MMGIKSPRRKQVPSIPNKTLKLANDSEAEFKNLPDLPAELPSSNLSPAAVGHGINEFEASDVAGWISAKASSYNPFSTGLKQAE